MLRFFPWVLSWTETDTDQKRCRSLAQFLCYNAGADVLQHSYHHSPTNLLQQLFVTTFDLSFKQPCSATVQSLHGPQWSTAPGHF